MQDNQLERLKAGLAGHYSVLRELGRGGMATVYLARDLKHARPVALKVLKPELAARLGAERFLREIRLTARLDHPHILPLLDSGQADGLLYYVMPYVEGETLRDRLKRETRLPLDEALALAREIADALSYAHSQGVLHRDIKPENILLSGGHARVADFGLARAVTTAGGDTLTQQLATVDGDAMSQAPTVAGGNTLTQTGIILGTPLYMSPEQATGQGELDARTDIYSLGCVVYEMLAGQPPFSGTTAQQIIARHLFDPVPSLRTVRPTVPLVVEEAIVTALAKAPADRFPTVTRFVDAIAAGRLSEAQPAQGRVFEKLRTHKRAVLGVAVFAALVVALVVITQLRTPPTMKRPTIAVLPMANLSPDPNAAYLADGLHDELISRLAMIAGLAVTPRASVLRYRGGTTPPSAIAAALGADFLVETSVRADAARIRVSATLIDGRSEAPVWNQTYNLNRSVASMLDIESDIAQQVAHALQVRISSVVRGRISGHPTESEAAYDLWLRAQALPYRSDTGASTEAETLLKQALALDSEFAAASAELAFVYVTRAYWLGQSHAWVDAGLDLAHRAIQIDDALPEAYNALGLNYLELGRLSQAAAAYRTMLDVQPSSGQALLGLGWIEFLRGRLAEAVRLFGDARTVDQTNTTVLGDMGLVEQVFGDWDRAQRWQDGLRALDPGPAGRGGIGLLLRAGKITEALVEAERRLSAQPGSFAALETAANVAMRAGDYQRARRHLDDLNRINPEDWNFWGLTYRTSYGFVLLKLGEEQPARDVLDRTLSDAMRLVDQGDERPGVRREIAAIHAARGEREQTYEWLARAIDAGWRHEQLFPSPLFESLHGEQRYRELMGRMQAEIGREKARVQQEGLGPSLP